MDVKATAKFIRMSPRKVRLVVDVVRGNKLAEARNQLQFMNKAAAKPVLKLINSAAANAVHNFNLKEEDLVVKTIMADEGPTIKRWKPRAHGRAFPIRKRTSHILVVLSDGKDAKDVKDTKVGKEVKSEKKETKKVPPTKGVAGSRQAEDGGKTKKPAAKKPVVKKAPAKKTTKTTKSGGAGQTDKK